MGLLAVREASGAWMQAAAMFRWMQVGGEEGGLGVPPCPPTSYGHRLNVPCASGLPYAAGE